MISHGFWPGGSWFGTDIGGPVYYSYAVPQPPPLPDQRILPAEAFFHQKLSEFVLMYDDVRRAESPREMLMDFLQSAALSRRWPAWHLPRCRSS